MTVQTVKLGGKRFVIVPEKDFRSLERRAKGVTNSKNARGGSRRTRPSDARDLADIELARKRLADSNEKPIPYEQARKQLGLE